ncbi:MAG: helix-turn-helix transcriptional regulator [Planctomyces sp.]|nr:helix-turn-helix transcriptional regulator [Planctomyces sp.]
MKSDRGKRVFRKSTSEELKRHKDIRQKIESELPDIRARAKNQLTLLVNEGTPIRQLLGALRAERQRLGLSLADINERTGIDRAALSRLENNEDANPTLTTLERYAEALGKRMIVLLSDVTS